MFQPRSVWDLRIITLQVLDDNDLKRSSLSTSLHLLKNRITSLQELQHCRVYSTDTQLITCFPAFSTIRILQFHENTIPVHTLIYLQIKKLAKIVHRPVCTAVSLRKVSLPRTQLSCKACGYQAPRFLLLPRPNEPKKPCEVEQDFTLKYKY